MTELWNWLDEQVKKDDRRTEQKIFLHKANNAKGTNSRMEGKNADSYTLKTNYVSYLSTQFSSVIPLIRLNSLIFSVTII